jgi:DNA-directed RNA polymerase subunit N (RpoN/RPB10)
LGVDGADVHAICVEVAHRAPYNSSLFRMNRLLCGGLAPASCFACGDASRIAPSHCAALTMRIVACARAGHLAPLASDASVFRELGIERRACAPQMLIGLTPREIVDLLGDAGAIGPPLEGFNNAIRDCQYQQMPIPTLILPR